MYNLKSIKNISAGVRDIFYFNFQRNKIIFYFTLTTPRTTAEWAGLLKIKRVRKIINTVDRKLLKFGGVDSDLESMLG